MDYLEWTDQAPDSVQQRGHLLYAEKRVRFFSEYQPNHWLGVVLGNTGDYQVEMIFEGETEVSSWSCDCPYHESPVCKHLIALATAIDIEQERRRFIQKTGLPQRLDAAPSFAEIAQEKGSPLSQAFLSEYIGEIENWSSEVQEAFYQNFLDFD